MRSLLESIFDSSNITKDYTFSNLFELDEKASRWENYQLDKHLSAQRIKSKTKVTGSDKNETIFRGLVKLIEGISLMGDPENLHKDWFGEKLMEETWNMFQHSSTNKKVYVMFMNNGHLILDRDRSLFDDSFDTIQINIGPDLGIVFRRK